MGQEDNDNDDSGGGKAANESQQKPMVHTKQLGRMHHQDSHDVLLQARSSMQSLTGGGQPINEIDLIELTGSKRYNNMQRMNDLQGVFQLSANL